MADRRRLARLSLSALLALASLAAPAAQQQRPAAPVLEDTTEVASYDIDVSLDPATRTLTGRETVTWKNPGAIPAYSIQNKHPGGQAPPGR